MQKSGDKIIEQTYKFNKNYKTYYQGTDSFGFNNSEK